MSYPADWQLVSFAEIASRSGERFDPRTAFEVLPCVQLEHIEQGTGTIIGNEPSDQQASVMNRFHPQQVLFGKLRPYLRKYAFPDFEGVCSSEIWVFDATSKLCLPQYLFYTVQSDAFIEATTVTVGSKMPRAEWNVVAASTFPLPPLAEQRRIAAVLGTWDEAIRLTGELITALRQRKQGLMQRLLTGEMRFPGFDGEWETVRLGDIADINAQNLPDSTNPEKTFFYIDLTNVEEERSTEAAKKMRFGDLPSRARRVLHFGDVMMSTVRPNLMGFTVCDFDPTDFLCSTGFALISPHDLRDTHYIHQSLFTDFVSQQIQATVTGTNYPAINAGDVRKLKLFLPSIVEEREKIGEVLRLSDVQTKLLRRYIHYLQAQKRGLMQQLLTGAARLAGEEA